MKKNSFITDSCIPAMFLALIFTSCMRSTGQYEDTPTTGNIKISVDETFRLIAENEIKVFEGLYKYSKINAQFKPETEIYKDILKDSVRLIISSRKLNEQERAYFSSIKFFPKETRIAIDGIALIVNNKNQDTLISVGVLKKILTGKITEWKQINKQSNLSRIKFVFDNPNSSTVRFLIDSVCQGEELANGLSAVKDNASVIEFVSNETNAIGVIGVSWVSNQADSTCMTFLNKVKVLSVSKNEKPTGADSFKPFQAYLSTGDYPLRRDIYVINSEPRSGLASGFAAFVASDKGQRIILKSGVLPATQPVRIVHINDNDIE